MACKQRKKNRRLVPVGMWALALMAMAAVTGWLWLEAALRVRPEVSVLSGTGERSPGRETPGTAIAVFFAPVEPLNPWGIDDYLVAFIQDAQHTLDAAFYELQLQMAADALVERHRHGVRVRLVSDSHYEDRTAIQQCVQAGIPVVFDKREAFMHNKFCIVDGRRVWTGSTNITENGMYRNNNNALRIDATPLAENFAAEFREMFEDKRFGKRSPKNTPNPVISVAGSGVECYFAPEDDVEEHIVSEIQNATLSIDFMAFSFTSKPLAESMADRMKKGVRVRGLFESRDMGSVYSQDDFLRERGAQVFSDQNPYNMHHKVIIIDGVTVITGSYNFGKNAETQNDENVVIVHNADLALRYTEEFLRLTRN